MNQVKEDTSSVPTQAPQKSYPIQGSNLYRILSEPEFKEAFHAKLTKYNPIIVTLYRIGLLPLFGAARSIMLLTTKGRKSGKSRQNPVGYFRIGGVFHLFSAWGKRSNWYKNLLANPDHVTIQIGWQKLPVNAQVLDDPAEIQHTLEKFITESPKQAHNLFGWDPAQDRIETADFSTIINKVLVVRFTEK
jgi:deazaflavin-dependent oxidoreductase (nitroreductase family)